MSQIKIFFILFLGLVCCSLALAQRGRGGYGRGGYGGVGGYGGMRGYGGYGGGPGYGVGFGGGYGGRGGRRYRSTPYNDDEIYGYEATYPGGEAMYINYRNSEARAKRAQEFARSNPYSSSSSFKSGAGQMGFEEQNGRDERGANNGPMW